MVGMTVGVLALQGAFAKHIAMLHALGVEAMEVRKPEDLSTCDGLIIPGGESTTIFRQIHFIHLVPSLREFSKSKPVFGTCAGLILMSNEIISDAMTPFGWLDVSVERNAYGRQAESFVQEIELHLESRQRHPMQAIFIRAPRICRTGVKVEILAEINGEPVLVKEGHYLGATFHPELSQDSAIHEYFIGMVRKALKQTG